MGADLPPMPSGGKGTAPSFVVWAVKDPTSANLDRIQVIKGWTQNGQSFEKVFDVAWSGDRKPDKWTGRVPAIQSTVDLEKATYTNSVGSTELKTVWTDPEFDRQPARVLLRPGAGDPDAALDAHSGREIRAAAARRGAAHGAGTRLELADLVHAVGRGPQERAGGDDRRRPEEEGRRALSDAQLKALIVGKAFWLRNNVTGEQFSQNFTTEGQTIVFRIGNERRRAERFRQRRARRLQGTTIPYKIEGGKLITLVSQEPYAFTFYKLGDTYYAARSNEFGYANYEIIPAPQIAVNPLTELSNQFSIELGLTEQQKQQIVPILKEELKQLGALKKDASLSAVQKVERLRQLGVSFDEKLKPLLNAEQQQKFQAMREDFRRRLIEEMAEKALQKLGGEVEQWFTEKSSK